MPLFRCFNSECPGPADFESSDAANPTCPTCRKCRKKNPMMIAEVATIHYLVADPDGPIQTGMGNRRIACTPTRAKLTPHATGERECVNCPRCKASPVFTGHDRDSVDQHIPIIEQQIMSQMGAG